MKDRIIAYDYIRIVAMLLVVSCHSFGDTSNAPLSLVSILSYIESPCNGLFFAVSGALLLPINNINGGTVSFLRKRLTKVVVPTLIWSLVYLALSRDISFKSILSIPFSPQDASIFWFVYTMVGLYLLSPIISPWLEKTNKNTLLFYLSIWCVTMCYPLISNWLAVSNSTSGPLYYFSGYIGYFILGYYLKRYSLSFNLSFLFFAFAFALMILVKIFYPEVALYNGFWYLSVFCIAGVVFYWRLLEKVADCIANGSRFFRFTVACSDLIFGVYFIHYGLIEYVISEFTFIAHLPYLLGYLIRIFIAFGGALFLSWIISYLPFANYIIGYKQKRI